MEQEEVKGSVTKSMSYSCKLDSAVIIFGSNCFNIDEGMD